jgi:hypothetical protein
MNLKIAVSTVVRVSIRFICYRMPLILAKHVTAYSYVLSHVAYHITNDAFDEVCFSLFKNVIHFPKFLSLWIKFIFISDVRTVNFSLTHIQWPSNHAYLSA